MPSCPPPKEFAIIAELTGDQVRMQLMVFDVIERDLHHRAVWHAGDSAIQGKVLTQAAL